MRDQRPSTTALDDLVRPLLHLLVFHQNLGFSGCEDTASQHRERQYHLGFKVPKLLPLRDFRARRRVLTKEDFAMPGNKCLTTGPY
jgi:hypothetical protein